MKYDPVARHKLGGRCTNSRDPSEPERIMNQEMTKSLRSQARRHVFSSAIGIPECDPQLPLPVDEEHKRPGIVGMP